MIRITDKAKCVGCNACAQRCPVHCISMEEDSEGFLYPKVDLNLCIECGLCEKVCPVINQGQPKYPEKTFAAWNNDDQIRIQSSSGGIFTEIATKIIKEGGIVFGAIFNSDWCVEHSSTTSLDGIAPMRTSKYLQSRINDSFIRIEQLLKKGKKVMFTGTPCQVAGLKLFLRKEYPSQLICIDFVCHGVPSPQVWTEYLEFIRQESPQLKKAAKGFLIGTDTPIMQISFRDKRQGWQEYGMSISTEDGQNIFQSHRENLFMKCFLQDLCLRPSCYHCPAKRSKSGSDLTMADFWGIGSIQPEYNDKRGVSLVFVNTESGKELLSESDINTREVSYEDAVKYNPAYERSVNEPQQRKEFMETLTADGFIGCLGIIIPKRQSIPMRIVKKIYRVIHEILASK